MVGWLVTWWRDLDLSPVHHLHLGQQRHEAGRVVAARDVAANGEHAPFTALLQQGVEQTRATCSVRSVTHQHTHTERESERERERERLGLFNADNGTGLCQAQTGSGLRFIFQRKTNSMTAKCGFVIVRIQR